MAARCRYNTGFLCLKRLKKTLPSKGSVVVYNAAFEKGILSELGNAFPEYTDWVEGVVTRMDDLLAPFRNFHYYHPVQKGSTGPKAVIPALTWKGYEGLEISNEGMPTWLSSLWY